MAGAAPVTSAEFAALMEPLGPFSDKVAVGCSGGPDSLALTRLTDAWARGRGASVLALIVEHGLRAESAAEASALAAGLAAEGIAARILPLGLPAGSGLQERARRARRAALLAACRWEGAPHLLLGHHAEDQAETVLFRALRGSGDAGLAGMTPLTVAPEALILRPLLSLPKARLAASLEGWPVRPIQDPSNADPRFARARLRAAGGGAIPAVAEGFARRRARRAARVAARLAASVRLLPEGCAEIAPARLGTDAVARWLMAALIRAVGGGEHLPAGAAVAALLARGHGSLGGAVWLRGGRWLVPEAGTGLGRFRLTVPEGLMAGPLGPDASAFRSRARHLPAAALAALPAFRRPQDGKLALVPHLAYLTADWAISSPPVFAPPGGPVTECHFGGEFPSGRGFLGAADTLSSPDAGTMAGEGDRAT